MTITPYPLQWPANRKRTRAQERKTGKFHGMRWREGYGGSYKAKADLTVTEALKRLQEELDKIGARYPVVSTNLETRLDGLPRSGQRAPNDPGVAVYFQLAGDPVCMPCDTYTLVEHNIAAVAAHIEATRAIERHGVASVKEMFSGFVAIPAQPWQRAWWAVLELQASATTAQINDAYRRLARKHHPDNGGSNEAMAELNVARDQALVERA